VPNPDTPGQPARLASGQTLATLVILWLTFAAGAAALIWLWDALAPAADTQHRRDPRVFAVMAFVALLDLPAIRYRRRFVARGLSGWPRVGFMALGTGTLLGLTWIALWLAATGGFGATPVADILGRMADLDPLSTRWNAGATLVLGVWFWVVSFIVASFGRSGTP
jgi:hypothetical protein